MMSTSWFFRIAVRTHGREKVMRCVDVVFDSAGLDSSAGGGFPLNEGDGIAGEEVVL